MANDMKEARLTAIEQVEQIFNASTSIEFSVAGEDSERYGHISRVAQRFDYHVGNKCERGALGFLQHNSDYSWTQVIRAWKAGGTAAVWPGSPWPSATVRLWRPWRAK